MFQWRRDLLRVMRTLYSGLTGDDVKAWQYFLIGLDAHSDVLANGSFDASTVAATKYFQAKVGFTGHDVDGVVGPKTLANALQRGFNPLTDERMFEAGPNWPVMPKEGPLSPVGRVRLFGEFAFKSAPTASNPEAIIVTDDWPSKNITAIDVPQLRSLTGAGKIEINVQCAHQVLKTFSDWEAAGLLDRILTWGGSYVPRYIRGSRTYLSNHAWGTAFDINVQWNMLGSQPALKGTRGSTRELVQIAYDNGMYWGGWFPGRPDGMHFECSKVIS